MHGPVIPRETTVFENTQYLGSEMVLLADRFRAAAVKLERERVANSFAGMRSAAIDLDDFRDQASLLTDSLNRSLEMHAQRYTNEHAID